MSLKSSTALIACLLIAAASALADERPAVKPLLQRQLETLVLPEVSFRDADFIGALIYLQKKARSLPQRAIRVPFVVDLPAEFQPRYELTLDLKTVPFWEVLRYLGEQAGVEFSIEREAIMIRPLGSASAAQATLPSVKPAPAGQAPATGLTGALGKPAEPSARGNYVSRSTDGRIQPEKSGYLPRRSMGGWSTTRDAGNGVGVNCVDVPKCPSGACGCNICCCRASKATSKPSP